MRLAELIEHPELRMRVSAPGEGLDREVRWVFVTELRDPSPYLHGGELVLTNGLWRRRRADSDEFVATIDRAGAVALGYGLLPPATRVPRDVVAACDRVRLPLLQIDHPVSFGDVSQVVAASVATEREVRLAQSVRRSRLLLHEIARGGGAAGVVQLLDRERSLAPVLIDPHAHVLAAGAWSPTADELDACRAALHGAPAREREVRHRDGAWTMTAVGRVERPEGFLVVRRARDDLSAEDREELAEAVAFLDLELARLRAVRDVELRHAGELVALLGGGSPPLAEVRAGLRALGLDPDGPLVALCATAASLDAAGAERVRDAFGAALVPVATAAVAVADEGEGGRGWEVVVLLAPTGDVEALVSRLAERVREKVTEVRATIGVGGAFSGADGVARSVAEARQAARLAVARGQPPTVAVAGDMPAHRLIATLHADPRWRAEADDVLRSLADYDRGGARLVDTLEAFLASAGRFKATAEALHIHENTLRYRLARVEALTGRSLGSTADRVELWLALRARP